MAGRRALAAVAVLISTTAASTGCTTDSGPPLLLLPRDGGELSAVSPAVLEEALGPVAADLADDLIDVRSATVVEAVPGEGAQGCGADVAEQWTDDPVDAPVVAIPGHGYTLVRSGPTADEDRTLTVVCDLDAEGRLLLADDLVTTGTSQAVGNDYAVRAGSIIGRVDVGIPEEAVIAVQSFDSWSLLLGLDPEMAVLRLHALEGGSPGDGYDIGTVRFFDARGEDVTVASIPIPDVVHGVPRDRGSSVDTRD